MEFKAKNDLKAIHLGTNAVRINSQYYLAIFHALRTCCIRSYADYPYLVRASPPYDIVKVSRSPLKYEPTQGGGFRFLFSSGLAFVDGRLVISYGYDDHHPNFHITSVEELTADMEELSPPAPVNVQKLRPKL